MTTTLRAVTLAVLAAMLSLGQAPLEAAEQHWKAGAAKAVITPRKSLWMMGFGARKRPSEGVAQELYAKALALEDRSGGRAVLVTSDILGFPAGVAANIAARVEGTFGISRERLLLNSSHTHCGPALDNPRKYLYGPRTSEEQNRDIAGYTLELEDKVVETIGAALSGLRPAMVAFGRAEAHFGINRRVKTERGWSSPSPNPEGVRDPDVPVLRVMDADGGLLAIVFGYACHNTAITAGVHQFHGDYAGAAQERLEARYPGAAAMFLMGCGGDIMAHPRGSVAHAERYGAELADAADEAMRRPMRPIDGPLRPAFEILPLEFGDPPAREVLVEQLEHAHESFRWHAKEMLAILDRGGELPKHYPYPLQAWQFGDGLTLLAMAGEVVVDYALRLKRELGAGHTWVAGYSNDVFAYIPSRRVLKEGGYEGVDSMIYYVQPTKFAPSIEETIVRRAHALVKKVRGE